LKEQLRQAVALEAFEEAAVLRDRIRALEVKSKKGVKGER
jgi:protein-arginine kinase activator protein McsA